MAGAVLEHAHLALALVADAAGRHIGHAAVGKADARIGNVDVVGEHARAAAVHADDLAIHQGQNQIDVVDHQIQQHAHIGGARLERGQPGALDEARLVQQGLQRQRHRVEALQVPDRQHQAAALGLLDHLVGLLQRDGDGFFHQHVGPGAQKVQRHGVVRLRRHHHAHGIDLAQQLAVVGHGAAAQRLGHGLRHLQPAVDHGHQFTAGQLGVLLGVELAQVADADHGTAQGLHDSLLGVAASQAGVEIVFMQSLLRHRRHRCARAGARCRACRPRPRIRASAPHRARPPSLRWPRRQCAAAPLAA